MSAPIVDRVAYSGALRISDFVDFGEAGGGVCFHTETYYGYSKREALARFRWEYPFDRARGCRWPRAALVTSRRAKMIRKLNLSRHFNALQGEDNK